MNTHIKIGITGGIGSGKSYICQLLAQRGIEVYDCDDAAKRLMRTSPTLRQQLTALIGPDTYLPEATVTQHSHSSHNSHSSQKPSIPPSNPLLNKSAVARFLLASPENASALDAIVHPAVFRDFEQSGYNWMESAILFESGAYRLVDKVVVVTAPEEIRCQRVMARDHISEEKTLQWMARQWPQEEVRSRADYEIVNDGYSDLESQIDRLLEELENLELSNNNY